MKKKNQLISIFGLLANHRTRKIKHKNGFDQWESEMINYYISVTKHCPDLQMEKASVGVSSVLAKDPVFGLNVMFVKLCDWEGREENYTNC